MFVTKNIYQSSGMRSTGLWGANMFLLLDNGVTLVDTGLRGRSANILNEVKRLGYKPSDIAHIILTHHHSDHMGSLAELKNATGAKVMAHSADAPYIDGTLPQPGPARPKWLGKMLSPFSSMWATVPAEVDKLLNDDDEFPILGGIRILHTPGHTPGSISLYLPQEKLVIVGDLLSHRFRLRLPSRLFTVDIAQEVNSVKRLAGLDFSIIAFGHGRPILHEAHQAVARFAEKLESKRKA
jgi:glyoxylase-like metal-dependent hydrolase (beta-lactamase superfamily II)